MEVDTLNKVEELVKDANAVEVITAPGEPSHVYYLRERTMVRRVEAAPAIIGHAASTLETLADKAADTVTGDEDAGESDAQVWVDRTGVVLLLDAERRNKVTLALSLSEQITRLQSVGSINYSQRELILLLRTTFKDALSQSGDLIPILRKVKFTASQNGESEVKHGGTSLGKTLLAEIHGTGAVPEYVTFSVPVFAQAGVRSVRAQVECALEPDAATQTFKLIPVAGAIEKAIGDGEKDIAEKLRGLLEERKAGGVSVFMGRP